MNNQLRTISKVELHCHLDGSISLEVIRKLADIEGIVVSKDNEELKALTMAPPDCTSLKQYLNCFSLAVSCMQTEETLRLAAYHLVEEAASENLIYIEVRFAPHLHRQKGLRLKQIVESVLLGLEQGRQKFDVEYGLILCAMRNESIENAMQVLELAQVYGGRKVVAMDLAGSEADYPVTRFQDVFREAAQCKIPFTIHAGEAAGAESVRNAVNLGAARIGHGITACQDRALLMECKDRGITFEFCPSSNIQTKAAQGWTKYPFMEFYNSGFSLTINTDNRRVTGTDMTREYELLWMHYGINIKDVQQLVYNAIHASFTDDGMKQKLLTKMKSSGSFGGSAHEASGSVSRF